ncbi:MAG: hypothetical protein VYE50_00090, partial [Candidatus Thermoplasmatota archaeon]|nr:hypothetical protein [Candidatus Thermoplasmatota archaeon]
SFSTKFVDENFSSWEPVPPSPEVVAAALLCSRSTPDKPVMESSGDPYSPWSSKGGWRPNV